MPTQDARVQAIFLDFDGTIVDSVPLKHRAFRSVVEEFAPDHIDCSMEYFLQNGGVSRQEKLRYIWTQILKRPLDPQKIDALANEFHDRVYRAMLECEFVAGAEAFLERWYKSVALFVISGTPQSELDDIVRGRRMHRYFQGVYGSPPAKPQTATRILTERGYDPNRVWFVGDATTDRDAAKAAGIHFVGLDGPHLTPFLEGDETIIPDMRELGMVLPIE